MARKVKFEKHPVSQIMRALDKSATKLGLPLVRYAATKWATGQRDKARLLRARHELEQELAEVSEKLRR
jgi:hypothetical protein